MAKLASMPLQLLAYTVKDSWIRSVKVVGKQLVDTLNNNFKRHFREWYTKFNSVPQLMCIIFI